MSGNRIDQYLVNQGFFSSRTKAHLAIERQCVMLNGVLVTQKSHLVMKNDEVVVLRPPSLYVGIGGEKLEPALRKYLPAPGFSALDIGASTGGFTDCMLQHGAASVVAVDIGSGQLHPKIASNPDVVALENTDIRSFPANALPKGLVDVIAIDVSFISLAAILPVWSSFLKPDGLVFALLKPQFQMEKRIRMRGGIVKSSRERDKILDDFASIASASGFKLQEVFPTSADGKTKNIEFMLVFRYHVPTTYIHA